MEATRSKLATAEEAARSNTEQLRQREQQGEEQARELAAEKESAASLRRALDGTQSELHDARVQRQQQEAQIQSLTRMREVAVGEIASLREQLQEQTEEEDKVRGRGGGDLAEMVPALGLSHSATHSRGGCFPQAQQQVAELRRAMSERAEEAGSASERVDALAQQLAAKDEQHEAEVAELRERMEELAQEAKERADEARRAERSAAETVRQKESAHAEQMKQVGGRRCMGRWASTHADTAGHTPCSGREQQAGAAEQL